MATIQEIKTNAQLVKNATGVGENTAERVGGVLTDITDYLYEKKNTIGTDANSVMSQAATTNAIINTIDLSSIDLDSDTILKIAGAQLPTRYVVTQSGKNVGTLICFSDNMLHMLTQVFTTHYMLPFSQNSHSDEKIFTYFRSYHISGGTSTIPTGTWGEWTQIYSSDNQKEIDALNASLQDVNTEITNLNANTGISDYEEFSDKKSYSAGTTILKDGLLKTFIKDHAAGAWDDEEVEDGSLKKDIEKQVTDLEMKLGVYAPIIDIDFNYYEKYIKIEKGCRIYSLDGKLNIPGSAYLSQNGANIDVSNIIDEGILNYASICVLVKVYNTEDAPAAIAIGQIGRGENANSSYLDKKLNEGYYLLAIFRNADDEYCKINASYYYIQGVKISNILSDENIKKYIDKYQLFSSKFINNITKSPQDHSIANYKNGVFKIYDIDNYAGLNFGIEKDDTDVYYIINLKSKKYTSWDSSTSNRITYGVRKYNGDSSVPSGLNIVKALTKVEEDGSLTLGTRIQNPNSLEDAVFRLLFYGEADTIYISSIKLYDEWEFEQNFNKGIGMVSFYSKFSKEASIAFDGDKYNNIKYPAVINTVTNIGAYTLNDSEYSLDAVINNELGYGNTFLGVSLPKEYKYYIGTAVLGDGYNIDDQPTFRLTGGDANDVNTLFDKTTQIGSKYVRTIIVSAKENTVSSSGGSIKYPTKLYFYGSTSKTFSFHIYDMKAWAINDIDENDFEYIKDVIDSAVENNKVLTFSSFEYGKLTADEVKNIDNIINAIVTKTGIKSVPGIVCWGSSTTAMGSWVKNLSTLTGLNTFNGGVGGENIWTIIGRIGSDPIRLGQSITIPAETTPIQLGTAGALGEGSILYVRSNKVTPLLQGDGLLNPVIIAGIEGTLDWTGSSYNDSNGYYTFTRSTVGEERMTLSDELVFSYGSRTMRNCIQILLLGYNGGYNSTEEYIELVKRAKEFAYNGMCLIIGRHAAANKEAADKIIAEETEFKKEFGMMFLSSREYMVLHGLEDAGIEPTEQDKQDISNGIVPTSLRQDVNHFNSKGDEVFLKLVYNRGKNLGYWS